MISRYLAFLSILFVSSCVSNVNTSVSRETAETTLNALLLEAMDDSNEDIRGISMSVIAPDIALRWTGAAGYDSIEKTDSLSADQPFRIASTTKTFVAAAILRLHEMNRLNIDESIGAYISDEHKEILQSGNYSVDSITFRHCLNHTSGLFDYAMGGNTFIEMSMKNPQRRWSRTDQLQIAMDSGKKIGYPGERYRYSDTGYILAGEAIETLMDSTLAYGLRTLLKFEELEMESTWLESLEAEPANLPRVVRRYFKRKDATDFDASIDLYGGGGLVSTTEDLATFMQALGSGKLFDKESSFDLMISDVKYDSNYNIKEDERYKEYKMGLWRINMYGIDIYMHAGLWGIYHLYIPELNSSIAINFTLGFRSRILKKTVLLLMHLHENKENL